MDLTKDGKPSAISELTLYAFRGGQRHTPKSLVVEAQLVAGGEWVVLKEVVDYEWFFKDAQDKDRSAPMYVTFDAVAAYAVRIVVTANTGDKGACGWYIPEVELAGPADFEIPDVPVDPEDPTDPSDPTVPSDR